MNLFLFSEDHLNGGGGAHVWMNPTMSSLNVLGALLTVELFNNQRIYI
jgi:hypothetical protein